MIEKHVVLRDIVWFDIATISEFIIKVSSPEHAKRYTQQLLDEFFFFLKNNRAGEIASYFFVHLQIQPIKGGRYGRENFCNWIPR